MDILDLRKNELEEDTADSLVQFVQQENIVLHDRIWELDKRLTNTNFLTNGGGAIAILAFIGENSTSLVIKIALILFTLGVIATGIELRALLVYVAQIAKDNRRRTNSFNQNLITASELGTIPDDIGKLAKLINHNSGLASQIFFVAGVTTGAFGFLYE